MGRGEVCLRRYMGQSGAVRNMHVGQQTDHFLTQSPFDRALSNMNCIMRSFMTCVARQILERRAMWHVCKELTNAYVFDGESEENRSLGEHRRKWEDLKKSNGMAWTGFVWGWRKLTDCCVHRNEHPGSINSGNFFTSSEPISFSRRTLLHAISLICTTGSITLRSAGAVCVVNSWNSLPLPGQQDILESCINLLASSLTRQRHYVRRERSELTESITVS